MKLEIRKYHFLKFTHVGSWLVRYLVSKYLIFSSFGGWGHWANTAVNIISSPYFNLQISLSAWVFFQIPIHYDS